MALVLGCGERATALTGFRPDDGALPRKQQAGLGRILVPIDLETANGGNPNRQKGETATHAAVLYPVTGLQS